MVYRRGVVRLGGQLGLTRGAGFGIQGDMSGNSALAGEGVPFPLADNRVQERLENDRTVDYRGYTPGPLDPDFPFGPPHDVGEVAAGDVMNFLTAQQIRSGVRSLLRGDEK